MMETTVPAEHQALGRRAKGFNRAKWDERQCFNRTPPSPPLTVWFYRQESHS